MTEYTRYTDLKEITKFAPLPVNVAGLAFKNPFFVASGPTTKSVRQLLTIEKCGWAAASIKLTIDPAPYVNRYPRYAIFKDRNSLAFTAEKRLSFEEGLRLVDGAKKELSELLLFANITYAGDEEGTGGWVNMAQKFEDAGADVIELNMCCPNMSYNLELTSGDAGASEKHTGASLGQEGEAVAEIVRAIKGAIKIPVFVKLTPEGGKIAQVAKLLYAAGADAVGGTADRLGIPPINIDSPASSSYHLQDEISMSCHAGEWLKPLAQRDTYEIRKVCGNDVKITATGGIRNARDAIEMAMCGADLIGICAETLISGYGFIGGVIEDTARWLGGRGATLDSIRNSIVPEVKTALELTLYEGYAQVKDAGLAAPCKAACPLHVPAQAYVRKVADGDIEAAYRLITGAGPLQGVCGYVCDRACERECTRGAAGAANLGSADTGVAAGFAGAAGAECGVEITGAAEVRPVVIREIKRFALEEGKKRGYAPDDSCAPLNGKRVAVIGGGPAGLSNAYYMRRAGYDVTVFEKEPRCGGMLRYAIPRFRLPERVIDDEIERIARIGVKFATGRSLGVDFTIESLKADGYSAAFLGVGARRGRALGIPGESAAGVWQAVDFLRRVIDEGAPVLNSYYSASVQDDMSKTALHTMSYTPASIKSAVVIGGGLSAVDAARTVVRLGAKNVYIAYRRTRAEMPVPKDELDEAEAEGVRIIYLARPVEIGVKNGAAASVSFCCQTLGNADNSGRRAPDEVEDAVFMVAADAVIIAAGQETPDIPGVDIRNGAVRVGDDFATADGFAYAGGDDLAVDNVIGAVAAGRKAAYYMDKKLSGGAPVLKLPSEPKTVDKNAVLRRNIAAAASANARGAAWIGCAYPNAETSSAETSSSASSTAGAKYADARSAAYTPALASITTEAARCLKCGCGEGCALCEQICCEFAVSVSAPDEIAIDERECAACGMCYNLCPNRNIEMINTGKKI